MTASRHPAVSCSVLSLDSSATSCLFGSSGGSSPVPQCDSYAVVSNARGRELRRRGMPGRLRDRLAPARRYPQRIKATTEQHCRYRLLSYIDGVLTLTKRRSLHSVTTRGYLVCNGQRAGCAFPGKLDVKIAWIRIAPRVGENVPSSHGGHSDCEAVQRHWVQASRSGYA